MNSEDIMNLEVRYLGDMQKVSLNPGDIVILQCERELSEEDSWRIKEYLSDVFKDNKCVVISGGFKFGVAANGS